MSIRGAKPALEPEKGLCGKRRTSAVRHTHCLLKPRRPEFHGKGGFSTRKSSSDSLTIHHIFFV